jgi:hypothetical protein
MTTSTTHKTADAAELEVAAKPLTLGVGLAPAGAGPRPDLNGLRLKSPAAPAIYLVLDGFRRWIPDPDTYNNLFRDWNGVIVDIDIDSVPEGSSLTSGAVLARPIGMAPVYLVSNSAKRWVTSPAAMDKYYFAWNRIIEVPHVLLDSIPEGPPIE